VKPRIVLVIAAAGLVVLARVYRRRFDVDEPFLSREEIDELERWPVLEEA